MLPAALATISAIAALAEAGGATMGAMTGAEEARKKRRQESLWHDEDLAQRGLENKMAQQRLGIEADQAQQQKPMNTLSFISGLEDLQAKRQKRGNGLEMLRSLAGR